MQNVPDERKELKKQLARIFHKAAEPLLELLDVDPAKQWGYARRVVNAAEKASKSATDGSLKRAFGKQMKAELNAIDEAVHQIRQQAYLRARSAQTQTSNNDWLRPQPTSISINSLPPRFTY